MKKLINSPDDVVVDALRGVAAAHPSLAVDVENKVITRAGGPTQGKVGLLSGGGSGHEPLHGGFVGHGMLDAACPGEVFTSPVPDQMLLATQAVDGGAGVLHIVKNYTGDVLNFQMAAELAADDGIEVASVVINDDVAVQDSLYTAGRRGTGATVFVEKIAGAARRAGPRAEVGRRRRPRGQRAVPVVRRRADRVHDTGLRPARLRPARRRDRARASASTASPDASAAPCAPPRRSSTSRSTAIDDDMPLEGELP